MKSKKRVTFEHKALNVKDPFKDANERFDSVKPTDVKALPGDKVCILNRNLESFLAFKKAPSC